MLNRPVIGICGSHNIGDRQLFIRENYMQSVLRAGGLPMLLPQVADKETAQALLDNLDGLLLAGGGDVEPARYGESAIPACGEPDAQRDDFELTIIPLALERHMPIFGICRGIQVLCVAMGGTLYQDIQTQCGVERAKHEQPAPYNAPVHTVYFEPDGFFSGVIGAKSMPANSMHHQSIKDPGAQLVVEGRTQDGIIEAVRGAQSDDVFAVQFHPEYLSEESAYAAKLFECLVSKARRYRAARIASPAI
ncbi:MAG: gamma-glutamyl-gamma-aminobutyrate hydrolase family protein [Clostridia bacterium]|nr:gamma-glutamyl-gamma-aminobutyrate hydrolase family protein [Clostridia bacterium]